MKTIIGLCVLAAVGFVALKQWNCHQTYTTNSIDPAPRAAQAVSRNDDPDAVVIQGRVYPRSELGLLYSKIKDVYTMRSGICYHRWQNPSGTAITYPEFIRQFSGGYCFTELSEPGRGDKVVLEHKGLQKRSRKNTSVVVR
ncbi:MAG: hypothetical protein V2A34_04550 [Lentisphaerota bacterium]